MKWREVVVGVLLFALIAAAVYLRPTWDTDDLTLSLPAESPSVAQQIAQGAYLARLGNCASCHTARGGEVLAGGRPIDTPFGTVFSSNLTPDPLTGLGRWTADDFWAALHRGQSKDGHWLTPAFPFTNYSSVTRPDSDAIWAWLKTQKAVIQANRPQTLRWPYDTQWALGLWRWLYFRPERFVPDARHTTAWNRGAYIVQGLGHCSACHTQRNGLGASVNPLGLSGGLIPQQNWYGPALSESQAVDGLTRRSDEVIQLLRTGVSAHRAVTGPMAEVVAQSTQYLSVEDTQAVAEYLQNLPTDPTAPSSNLSPAGLQSSQLDHNGQNLYQQHCAACHGQSGQGVDHAYPALAANRAVLAPYSMNLVQTVLKGGFAPATAENPRPFGMPPFALVLDDNQVAAVLSYVRSAWGNHAGPVSAMDVDRLRPLVNH